MNFSIIPQDTKIALAVSGGPDSMAMLHMFYKHHLDFVVLTVEHHLRDESKDEALYVSQFCSDLGVPHVILDWNHNGINSNVHAKAREARYSLMTEWCKSHDVKYLCTAHHMDDRVENLFLRLYKGSGILGLIDHDVIDFGGVKVLRPLFDLTKNQLLDYLNSFGVKYYMDQSNFDDKYLRSIIRKWIELMPESLNRELFKRRIITSKNSLKRSSEVLLRLFEIELCKVEKLNDNEMIINILPEDKDIAFMLLSRVLRDVGCGSEKLIRTNSLEQLYNNLQSKAIVKSTLGGCLVVKNKFGIKITKEKRI